MANVQGMCTSFKMEILKGSHAFGAQSANSVRTVVTEDTFKGALFLVSGSRGVTDTAYNSTGEVSGANYTAGGAAVTNATAPNTSGTGALWTPSASLVWTAVTLSTAFDTVVIYNTASTGSLEVSVHTFGSQTITAGTFTLTMPANTTGNALVQIA